jgi:hypothetical protein
MFRSRFLADADLDLLALRSRKRLRFALAQADLAPTKGASASVQPDIA